MITKTLSLRIIRPFYSAEVENEIKTEKQKHENGHISYHDKFWSDLGAKHPEIMTWDGFGALLRQLQKNAAESYNVAISKLYQEKIITKNKAPMSVLLSRIAYTEFYNTFKSAYIASGLRQKIQSNFREKELRRLESALPTAKSDGFPIPFWIQEGIDIETYDKDFIITIKFPAIRRKQKIDKYRPWEIYDFIPRKTQNIRLLLSTKKRQRNKTWNTDSGTDAEIRRLLNGEHDKMWIDWLSKNKVKKSEKTRYENASKVSWLEIVQRKRTGFNRSSWFANLVIKIPELKRKLDEKIVGGIDVGVKNPLYCAIDGNLARLSIDKNQVFTHNLRMRARIRAISRQNYLRRVGHGEKNKLKPVTDLTEKSEQFRKKLIENWAVTVVNFFIKHNVGKVKMEDLTSMKNKNEDYFNSVLRISWPYYQMQNQIINKLKEKGIKYELVNPKNTSKTCSKCGEVNETFNFEYRKAHGFPPFKCNKCNFEADADYNAALNISKA